jgi:hypothetical protein
MEALCHEVYRRKGSLLAGPVTKRSLDPQKWSQFLEEKMDIVQNKNSCAQ